MYIIFYLLQSSVQNLLQSSVQNICKMKNNTYTYIITFYPYQKQKMAETQKPVVTDKSDTVGKKVAAPVAEEAKKEAKPVAAKASKPSTKATAAQKVDKEELMKKHQQMVQFIQNVLSEMESNIKRMHMILNQLAKRDPENAESLESVQKEIDGATGGHGELKAYNEENAEVVEGKFDGYFMVGADQKKYPVPLNYSSKTKLVPGDMLKLKILEDGKFIYKLIQPVERKHIRAVLSITDDNKFVALSDEGKSYFLNQAAVTFFKGKPGDELYVLINDKEDMSFAAIEAIIKK